MSPFINTVGYRDALPYYQLYYVFIHIHLYGASYCGHAQRIIENTWVEW